MLELNKLYNMDCMQGMKEFPDGFFDLAIVDPPYGIGIDGQKKRVCGNPKHNRKEHIRKSWDKAIPPPEYFRELERVSKEQVIWGGNYFVPYLEQGHKGCRGMNAKRPNCRTFPPTASCGYPPSCGKVCAKEQKKKPSAYHAKGFIPRYSIRNNSA